jgi:hypothetical protein
MLASKALLQESYVYICVLTTCFPPPLRESHPSEHHQMFDKTTWDIFLAMNQH